MGEINVILVVPGLELDEQPESQQRVAPRLMLGSDAVNPEIAAHPREPALELLDVLGDVLDVDDAWEVDAGGLAEVLDAAG